MQNGLQSLHACCPTLTHCPAQDSELEKLETRLGKWTASHLNSLLDLLDLPRGTGEEGIKVALALGPGPCRKSTEKIYRPADQLHFCQRPQTLALSQAAKSVLRNLGKFIFFRMMGQMSSLHLIGSSTSAGLICHANAGEED